MSQVLPATKAMSQQTRRERLKSALYLRLKKAQSF